MSAIDKNVLIIDDDAVILTSVKLFLQNECHVYAVNSGRAAIDFLQKKKADLIFLDYEMPIIKGPKVLRMIRDMKGYEDVPIVFMTGVSEKDKVMSVLKLNPHSYIVKPVTYEKLKNVLDDVFGDYAEEFKEPRVRDRELKRVLDLIEDYEVFEASKLLARIKKYESGNSMRQRHLEGALQCLEKYDTQGALVQLRKIGID